MIGDYYCWLDFGNEPSIVQSRQSCCGCKDACKETGQALNEGPRPSDPSPGPDVRRRVLDILNAVAPAVENLAGHQEQCDMDGVMVKVSRQALDEVLNAVNEVALVSALTRPQGGSVLGGSDAHLTSAHQGSEACCYASVDPPSHAPDCCQRDSSIVIDGKNYCRLHAGGIALDRWLRGEIK